MKLLVIVLCLLSERYLVHVSSHRRFHWFQKYADFIDRQLSHLPFMSTTWARIALFSLPILSVVFAIFYLFGSWIFGIIGFLLQLGIFYYCIGPNNPFYPRIKSGNAHPTIEEIGSYFVDVNGQLFAGIFWYIILGPIALLAYRLISLSKSRSTVAAEATLLTNILDWIPARITALLYLFVGHYQAGVNTYTRLFFTRPELNATLLQECGIKAIATDSDSLTLPVVETHIEHAMVLLLALIAIFTIVSWM